MTCIIFFLLSVNKESRFYVYDGLFVTGIGIFTMTIATVHINYLDKVHFEQTELLKEKQIMNRYIRTLERSQTQHDS